jgi:hypothetical protein
MHPAQVTHQSIHDLGRLPAVNGQGGSPHGEFVPHQCCLLMRSGIAAEIAQQRQVIDLAELADGEAERFSQANSEHAGVQDIFHGLAHTKVGGDRECRHQLCQPYL